MEIVFLWLVFAGLVGMFASSRGRSGFGFFLLAVVLSPLIGFIIVLVIPNLVEQQRLATEREREQERKDHERKQEHEKQLAALQAIAGAKAETPASPALSVVDEIAKLGALKERGLLTDAEFAEQKAAVLRRAN